MKEMIELIFSAENIRMLVILAAGFAGFVWQNTKTEKKLSAMDAKFEAKFAAMDAKIDRKFAEIDAKFYELRYNDFAHLTTAFKSLTFVLKENQVITEEQQSFIDSALQPHGQTPGQV
jgi:Skp family chaperone for outer membrane proteins